MWDEKQKKIIQRTKTVSKIFFFIGFVMFLASIVFFASFKIKPKDKLTKFFEPLKAQEIFLKGQNEELVKMAKDSPTQIEHELEHSLYHKNEELLELRYQAALQIVGTYSVIFILGGLCLIVLGLAPLQLVKIIEQKDKS
ncbi:MAG: hypothetical protein P9M07_01965 [Candidatus Aceula meridiana]|nr:hypothetical protein [Candidatus Aceula meridiana]